MPSTGAKSGTLDGLTASNNASASSPKVGREKLGRASFRGMTGRKHILDLAKKRVSGWKKQKNRHGDGLMLP